MSMPNGKRAASVTRAALVLGLAAGAALIVPLGLLVRQYGPGNMGNGILMGGAVALIGFAFAAWRAWNAPDRASPLDRALTGLGDERDDAVLTSALAVVGATALPLTGLATVAIAVNLRADVVLALLVFSEAVIFIGAYLTRLRRA